MDALSGPPRAADPGAGHRRPAAPGGRGELRVCYVTPTYFAPESYVGGGERFAEELARAMARRAAVKLVSFGGRARRERVGPTLERVILASWSRDKMVPFSPWLRRELRGADVVHCHQYFVLPTFLAACFGHRQGSRVFVSDLGGGALTPGFHFDQSRWITAHLPISEYAARALPGRARPHHVIYCGVDPELYPMRAAAAHDGSAAFLGRILPHKGIHHLIPGLPPGMTLHVIGPALDQDYLDHLRHLAAGKDVHFHHELTDAEVVAILQRAMALVHPTPVDAAGSAGANELFGIAPLEAMACGCPVIASRAASLPEIVEHERSGLLVPPNDPAAIGAALTRMATEPELWTRLSAAARRRVEERFTWDHVAERCLAAYQAGAGAGERAAGEAAE
ncbi:MAG TPA: glycosyltransferase family 4 protein [Thermoanaerobaculia bacterium]|nr:glycosyltransferase family 4 protein [Thermoanaerobaculia bacterium]